MDMLPIQPMKNNLIKPTTGTANDGGSKSQGGYINVRGDEVTISDESKRLMGEDPVVEERSFFIILKDFIISFIKKIIKLVLFMLPEKKQVTKKEEKIEKTEEKEEKLEPGNFLKFTRHDNDNE